MQQHLSLEMRHVSPLRFANVTGLVYGLLMIPITLLLLPLFLLIPLAESDWSGEGIFAMGFMSLVALTYPVMGFIMGWIGGLLASAIYNLVVKWIGGYRFRFQVLADAPGPSVGPGN